MIPLHEKTASGNRLLGRGKQRKSFASFEVVVRMALLSRPLLLPSKPSVALHTPSEFFIIDDSKCTCKWQALTSQEDIKELKQEENFPI